MIKLNRIQENPLLSPLADHDWETIASFNPSVVYADGIFHMVYRALTHKESYHGVRLELSTIGYAVSSDGIHFTDRKKLIEPEHEWEYYGCEDPRITKIDDMYYIFYTALSTYPFSAPGIKVGLAITKDFQTISEKYLVTPFNAKAMSLFPEKVNGKYVGILTVNTDIPPAKIAIAYFDKLEEIWDPSYWENWYAYLDDHILNLQRETQDHIEIGAPPVKTDQGWLLIYSYIKDYFSEKKRFGIEGVMLETNNPLKCIARTSDALLVPEEPYEKNGNVPNIAFPSGALLNNDTLSVYYGGADTVSCLATCSLAALLRDLTAIQQPEQYDSEIGFVMFQRFEENPILRPIQEHEWQRAAVFNPGAIYEEGKVHLLYRAVSAQFISTLGYASSDDGFHITYRSQNPVYLPREAFEINADGKNYGCEDPRLTKIADRIYLCYTAYNGHTPPGVALSSIAVSDFIHQQWQWEKPRRISPPDIDDKDACLFPKQFDGKYVFLHRLKQSIWIDYISDVSFPDGQVLSGEILLQPREDKWDTEKIGIASPPLETKDGWILLYHGIDNQNRYSVGAVLLNGENPKNVLARLDSPVFIPEKKFEKEGVVPNVVFPCGAVLLNGKIIMYYGAADKVTGVASLDVSFLLEELNRHRL